MENNIDLTRLDIKVWNTSVDRMFKNGFDNLSGHQNPWLVEGLLLNMPFPKTIAARRNYGKDIMTITNDSRNLVSALKNFIDGLYPMNACRALKSVDGLYFKDLAPNMQRRLTEMEICVYMDVSYTTPENRFITMFFEEF